MEHGKRSNYLTKKCRCSLCRDAEKDYQLRKKYGITLARFNQMMINQNHECAACRVEWIEWEKQFAVDHDHATGQVRGLLCQGCNVALGHIREDPKRLAGLVEYLQRYSV